ncbi:MAG: DNA-binding protein [Candidatus Accumulibacter sp.]|nr:DNA-binding protein [Accumulibacter sp.]
MARESTITLAAVSEAADRIKTAGGTPTARAIREALGTGSMATVLRMLQAWQAGQIKPPAREVVLPHVLQKTLVDFIAREVANASAALQAELEAAQQATADVLAENERLAAEIDERDRKIAALTTERDQASAVAGERSTEIERLAAEVQHERATARHAQNELVATMLRLEQLPRLESEIKRLQALQEAEREARTAADLAAAVATARLEERTGSIAGTAV